MPGLTFEMADAQATLDTGALLASALLHAHGRFLVTLTGDLGAGKTTLVRGVLRGLSYGGRVKSPTYPLLEQYTAGSTEVNHFDLYRLETPEAFIDAGFDEILSQNSVSFIEWPDRAQSLLPPADWQIAIESSASDGRILQLVASTEVGLACLNTLTAG